MVHIWTLLNLFLHLAACQSVTMPALLPSSAQQSAKNKLQNRLNLINRTTLIQFILLEFGCPFDREELCVRIVSICAAEHKLYFEERE